MEQPLGISDYESQPVRDVVTTVERENDTSKASGLATSPLAFKLFFSARPEIGVFGLFRHNQPAQSEKQPSD
jgi:hypothetical protein